jgi:hypothetical protein
MQMQPKHIDKIVRDEKTETRRLVKPEHDAIYDIANGNYDTVSAVFQSGRLKWQVGRNYSVQPGRTRKGVYSTGGIWFSPEDWHWSELEGIGARPLRIRMWQELEWRDSVVDACEEYGLEKV